MEKILGIDLGTYNSEGAILTIPDDGEEIEIQMVGTGAQVGSIEKVKSYPSFVSYLPDGTLQSVGLEAKNRLSTDPKLVIWGMKRLLGKTYSEAVNQKELDRFLFEVDADLDTGQCCIVIGNKKLRPEDVCAELIKKIKEEAQRITGVLFRDVVISVPAYFDAVPKTSIINAAKIAGFESVRTIPEPVAAAIVYRIPISKRPLNVLVFDLGAGTLDVTAGSLVRKGPNVQDIVFIIKTTTGSTHLGGLDMDDRMEMLLLKKMGLQDKSSLTVNQRNWLREKAEEAKIQLSVFRTVEVEYGVNQKFNIDEDEFKGELRGGPQDSDLLEEIDTQVYQALENVGWKTDAVEQIFLIGGPSSLPLIQERLAQIFANNPIVRQQIAQFREGEQQVDLMQAVAQGAALSQETKKILTHPYGYGIVDLEWKDDEIIQKPVILIPRDSVYPTKKSATYINWFSNQAITDIEIIQQVPKGSDKKEYRTLGGVGISPQYPGLLPIEVSMQLNDNEELIISLTEILTGMEVGYAGIGALRRAPRSTDSYSTAIPDDLTYSSSSGSTDSAHTQKEDDFEFHSPPEKNIAQKSQSGKDIDSFGERQYPPFSTGTGYFPEPRIPTQSQNINTLENVYFSLAAPRTVSPGFVFILSVWAHLIHQRSVVKQYVHEEIGDTDVIFTSKGPSKVKRNTIYSVMLKIEGMDIENCEDRLEWVGEAAKTTFMVKVPENALKGPKPGKVQVFVNGLLIMRIDFTISVGENASSVDIIPMKERRVKTAFISYSNADFDEVIKRIQGIQAGNRELEIFLDKKNIRPGARWKDELRNSILNSDVFYLFWSKNASESKWVEKEWRCALKNRGIEYICPVPLISPEHFPPPHELGDEIHFGDWTQAYMRGKCT